MEQTNPLGSLKGNLNLTEDLLGSFKIIRSESTSGDHSLNGNNKSISEYRIGYNETRQTNRHKNPSGVWRYFALATKDKSTSDNPDEPDNRILCMLCYGKDRVHVYKSKTSSSNLWKHLNRKHGIETPTEKMFTLTTTRLSGFEFNTDSMEHSQDDNSIDDQLSGLDVDDNGEIVVKTNHFEELGGFNEEQIIETSMDGDGQSAGELVKYEPCSSDAVFKDIGLAIIEEVSKRPILYEQSCKSPSNRTAKEIMWMEVFEALGEIIQIDRIQKIWKNIRDRYRKIRTAEKDGLDDSPHKYKYYNRLRFLDVVMPIEETSDTSLDEPPEKKIRTEDYSFLIEQTDPVLSTVDDLDRNEQNFEEAEEIMNENNCTVSSSDPPITTTIYPLEITHNRIENQNTPQKECPIPLSSNNSEQLDEFDLFGKLIAKKLRSVRKDRVNLIEVKIMQAILENS